MKTGNENKNPAHKWERLVSNRTHQHYSSGALSAWIHKWVRWMWWMMWSLTSRSLRLSTLPDLFSFSTRCSSVLTEYNQSAERTSNHVQYSRAHFQRLWVVTTQWWWLEHDILYAVNFVELMIRELGLIFCTIIELCGIWFSQDGKSIVESFRHVREITKMTSFNYWQWKPETSREHLWVHIRDTAFQLIQRVYVWQRVRFGGKVVRRLRLEPRATGLTVNQAIGTWNTAHRGRVASEEEEKRSTHCQA